MHEIAMLPYHMNRFVSEVITQSTLQHDDGATNPTGIVPYPVAPTSNRSDNLSTNTRLTQSQLHHNGNIRANRHS